ncbi:MAG: DNA double-strand break repair nuclease NurA [Thermomicrobium sp.]|nr:DNA double-strand break repair nuclease NurA [Thermomicrobium sp.]
MPPRSIFLDLPAALVEELLGKTPELSRTVVRQLEDRARQRRELRDRLAARGLLARVEELPSVPIPTSCGVDGSIVVERLLAHDLLITGALAVEGLTPPSEERHWPEPRHAIWIELEHHAEGNDELARAMMAGLEVELAAHAPHEVVLLDGSLATPVIAFDQAIRALAARSELTATTDAFWQRLPTWLELLHRSLASSPARQCWLGIPKYTTRRDIANLLGAPDPADDRALLTALLEPGEYTAPIPLQPGRRPHGFSSELLPAHLRGRVSHLALALLRSLADLRVVYLRPHRWLPALRLELPAGAASDPSRLAGVLAVVQYQSARGALVEPFPLFLADRMVRHLRRAARALRHAVREAASREYPSFEEIFLALESYRSEALRSP